jgi:hypothetical protein
MTDKLPTLSGARPDEDCGDFGIRIGRDGTWFYHESPIRRLPLAKLFSSVLRREADGSYWLVTPVERGRIVVEDVPFIAIELISSGEGEDQVLEFRTNLDDRVTLDAEHGLRVETDPETGEPRPYVMIRGGLEARLARSVFYHVVELGTDATIDGIATFGVWSRRQFFPLGPSTAAT